MFEIELEDAIVELKEGDIVRCYSNYHGCGMIKGIYMGVVIGDYIVITDVGFLKTVGKDKRYPGFLESEYWEESFEKIEVVYREERPEGWEDIFPSKRQVNNESEPITGGMSFLTKRDLLKVPREEDVLIIDAHSEYEHLLKKESEDNE